MGSPQYRMSGAGERNGARYSIAPPAAPAPYQQQLNGQGSPTGNGVGTSTNGYKLQKRNLNKFSGED